MPDADKMKDEIYDAANELGRCTIGIAQFDKQGEFNEIRSGVLLQISEQRFLVTAGHGLAEYLDDRPLALFGTKKGDAPLPLVNEYIRVTKDENEDLAVAQLTDETLANLSKHYQFIRLTDVLLDRRADSGFYLLLGYPSQRVSEEEPRVFRSEIWKVFTIVYGRDKLHKVERYNPDLHIVVVIGR